MKKEQILKILSIAIIMTIIILAIEVVFTIPMVNDWFSRLITQSSGWVVYLVIWLIMFLQTTILNVPAYVVLTACVSMGIKTLSWVYLLVVISAYMSGCILAYFIGRKWGKKAVKWCAGSEEDYAKWSAVLNTKGKWWYLASVTFPMFPDDILCLVAGAVKFDFKFYVFANFVGRTLGLITTLLCLEFVGNLGGGFPLMLVIWTVALIIECVSYHYLKKKENKDEPDIDRE